MRSPIPRDAVCAVAIDADAPFGRGDLHLLLHDAPASSGEAGSGSCPILVYPVYFPRKPSPARPFDWKRIHPGMLDSSATGTVF